MSISIYVSTLMETWWSFVFWYAFMFPMGIGIVYWVPIMAGWEWFPERKGLVSGLIVAGYGFGAFFFGFISTAIANPEDDQVAVPEDGSGDTDKIFPKEVGDEVPHMLRVCLIYWIILSLICVATIQRNPEFVAKEKARIRAEKIEKQREKEGLSPSYQTKGAK
mmetsp:Transcript_35849/g.54972  ORF Transcript_35849/g.54972 Transcript_35849/m.54972 type:complete len:164 (+) Transcript_35849:341-832(+)